MNIDNLTASDILNKDRLMALSIWNPEENESCMQTLTEQQAADLTVHFFQVFVELENNVSILHFPVGAKKSDCLRAAADRAEERGE